MYMLISHLQMTVLMISSMFLADVRNILVVTCMFVFCTVLAPILWHLWIYAGSANANFYFAITLVYSTGQVSISSLVLWQNCCG
jgi:phosphatidylinositol glycan class U